MLAGLSAYEVALTEAKRERKAFLARVSEGVHKGQIEDKDWKVGKEGKEGNIRGAENGGKERLLLGNNKVENDVDALRDAEKEKEIEKQKVKEIEDEKRRIMEKEREKEREKMRELERQKERLLEIEREKDRPLEDMSKDELKEKFLPYLAGDLFLIWRETDLASEKEKKRLKNKLLQIEEDLEGVSLEVQEERRKMDAMTIEERNDYDKDKREEVVYTMLQVCTVCSRKVLF